MHPKNTLELPEIVLHVASYLKTEDLARCLRVSRRWYNLLLPLRWRVVKMGSQIRLSKHPRLGPHPDDIRLHRHLIHDLTLKGGTTEFEGHNYPNVSRLTICRWSVKLCRGRPVSLDLLEMSPSLAYLDLQVNVAAAVWSALSALPHMRTLHLNRMVVNAVAEPDFWRACAQLETLNMQKVHFATGTVPVDMVLDRMRNLKVLDCTLDAANQLDLIIRCPNLKKLHWTFPSRNDLPTLLAHPIPKGHWPHLDTVSFGVRIGDRDLSSLLEDIGENSRGPTRLYLSRCCLQERASRAIGLHFSNLVQLDLTGCSDVKSTIILDILCLRLCPRLEVLDAWGVLASDVVQSEPWDCPSLQMLSICFWFLPSEQDLQQDVFKRLSTLNRLHTLIMFIPGSDRNVEGRDVLKYRLDCGIGHLADLRLLRTLDFDDCHSRPYTPQLGVEEVEWMATHWKHLQFVSGEFNKDPEKSAEVGSALQLRGIDVRSRLYRILSVT